ncbi:MAG: AtpZ/AtpI family protein [Oscillospiraceae bacterium]|nr:AtpZ/AtpI family protein [Oscillospiraceae bacterium]
MAVKNLNLLVWLTQLGLSVALPPVGFILFAVWLRNRFNLGEWILWIGILLGIVCAIDGLRMSLKAMKAMCDDKREEPPVSFNDHD